MRLLAERRICHLSLAVRSHHTTLMGDALDTLGAEDNGLPRLLTNFHQLDGHSTLYVECCITIHPSRPGLV